MAFCRKMNQKLLFKVDSLINSDVLNDNLEKGMLNTDFADCNDFFLFRQK